ncbi:MAG: hypothetical protein AVDCRST_MAG15-1774 [uncultured Rubellimicrobium sp.]|uniref:Uncharacterized protein n=1 Tax=uncultured Rubellimicrobium sp. TaxID=543078 RepID=A0A6J4PGN8_9RHOB|nr:MAG: hypothetical protein AVDCRST_MAG15-1774 [uncultured Rubellimicrobium sp.]
MLGNVRQTKRTERLNILLGNIASYMRPRRIILRAEAHQ